MPEHDPVIRGMADYYNDGDEVRANCTTARSSPPATITWYLNGQPVDSEIRNIVHQDEDEVDEQKKSLVYDGFQQQVRSLELSFLFDRHRHLLAERNTFELGCRAQVDGLPSVPYRDTIRIASLREDVITNQKQMRPDNGGGCRQPLIFLHLSLFLLCVLVTNNRSTQLS